MRRDARRGWTAPVLLLCAALLGAGCEQAMKETPRYEPYEANPFYEDSLAMRPFVEGTVPRGESVLEARYYVGTNPYYRTDGTFIGPTTMPGDYVANLAQAFPFEVTREVLARGQQRFEIYCSPCHGRLGNGQGMVVMRGLRAMPSFHTDRLREAPPGHFFNVITNGYGAMYSYASRIEPADRWAIIAYIRALQLSQHASVDDVPADRRTEMQILTP